MRLSPLPVLAAAFLLGCGLIDRVNGPDNLAIQQFVASPDDVASGASVTLSWDVQGAEAVQIDNGVGTVPAKGTKTFPAYRTLTYTLTAKSGTSSATASVKVSVQGSSGDPFQFLAPTPTPGPNPSPDPSPSPSPSPEPITCDDSITSASGCTIVITPGDELPAGQCVALSKLSVDEDCPLTKGQKVKVKFEITANVAKAIRWKKNEASDDEVTPGNGRLLSTGTTKVAVRDEALGEGMGIDVLDDAGAIYLHFSVKHR